MTNNLEPFKELYDTLTLIRDLPERSDTLISRALELALEVEHVYKLVEAENDEMSGKYNGCVIERNIVLRKRALELTEQIAVKNKNLQGEVSNLARYIGKAGQEHTATRNDLDKANTDLVRAYVQIGKAYMREVENSENT